MVVTGAMAIRVQSGRHFIDLRGVIVLSGQRRYSNLNLLRADTLKSARVVPGGQSAAGVLGTQQYEIAQL